MFAGIIVAAAWAMPPVDHGPIGLAVGAAAVGNNFYTYDGMFRYTAEDWALRLDLGSKALWENPGTVVCEFGGESFMGREAHEARLVADGRFYTENLVIGLGGDARGRFEFDDQCTVAYLADESGEAWTLSWDSSDRTYLRAGGAAAIHGQWPRFSFSARVSGLAQDEVKRLDVDRAFYSDSSDGTEVFANLYRYNDRHDWSLALAGRARASAVVIPRWVTARLLVEAERYERTISEEDYLSRVTVRWHDGVETESSYEEALASDWTQILNWDVSQRLEIDLAEAILWGATIRLWQQVDWSSSVGTPSLGVGGGLRWADEDDPA